MPFVCEGERVQEDRAGTPIEGRHEALGRVEYSDKIFIEIAYREARKVPGVVDLRGSFVEALTGRTKGIQVDRSGHDVSIDLKLSVEYGANIPLLAARVRDRVAQAVHQMTGKRVRAVNIHVDSIQAAGSAEHDERETGAEADGF